MSTEQNRKFNAGNPNQGDHKRVLCVCSAGLLRSPTAAFVLSQEPFSFNTRACGAIPDFALVPIDSVLLHWADEVVCMDNGHRDAVEAMGYKGAIVVLGVPDNYEYRDPRLCELIGDRYVGRSTEFIG